MIRLLASTFKRELVVVGFLCFVLGGIASLCLGQDANFDLLNYHFANGFSLAHLRMGADYHSTSPQPFFNPILDYFFFVGATRLPPRLFGFLLGGIHGLCLLCIYALVRISGSRSTSPRLLAIISTFVAALSWVFVSEIGTAFHDLLIALLILIALILIFQAPASGSFGKFIKAGFAVGAAIGLKLTALIYLPGLVLATIVSRLFPNGIRGLVKPLLLFFVATTVAFLLIDGPWMMWLWREHRSPVFPLFNQWLRSPDYPPVTMQDTRFILHQASEWLTFPIQLLLNGFRAAEVGVPAPNIFCWYTGSLICLIFLLFSTSRRKSFDWSSARPILMLYAFFLGSYIPWLKLFGILRYAVVLDLLAPAILLLFASFCRVPRAVFAALVLALVILPFRKWDHIPTWGRLPWSASYFDFRLPIEDSLLENAVIFRTESGPNLFLVSAFPPSARLVNVDDLLLQSYGPWQNRTLKEIAAHDRLFAIKMEGSRPQLLNGLGLTEVDGSCKRVATKVPVRIELCAVSRK